MAKRTVGDYIEVRVGRGDGSYVGRYGPISAIGRARAELLAEEAELNRKLARLQERVKIETVESFATRWPDDYLIDRRTGERRWTLGTQKRHRLALKKLIAVFGPLPLREVTDVSGLVGQQTTKYSQVARTMWKDAIKDGLADFNPFDREDLKNGNPRRDPIPLTPADIEQLIAITLETCEPAATIATMIAVMAWTGVRPAELFALAPESVDVAGETLHVNASFNGDEYKLPKNDLRRDITLPPEAGAWIQRYPRPVNPEVTCPNLLRHDEMDGECLCRNTGKIRVLFQTPRNGGIFSRSDFYYYWNTIVKVFGKRETLREGKLRFVQPYDLRHYAGSILYERLVEINEGDPHGLIAKQLGHTDGGQLSRQIYTHPDELRQLDRIRAAHRGGAKVHQLRSVDDEAAHG